MYLHSVLWDISSNLVKAYFDKSLSQDTSIGNYLRLMVLLFSLLCCFLLNITPGLAIPVSNNISPSIYSQKSPSVDGIGKVYMGREIARVMGHTGAGWLERPSREVEEAPSKLIAALALKPDDVVADIGAGTGYISLRMAPLLSRGKVFAVDVQPEMLEIIKYLQTEKNIDNVETVLATPKNPRLSPHSIDLALMVDVYHELEYPQEMMEKIITALKPGGKVVLVEYRAENPLVMIKRLHKMSQKQVKREMQAVGLKWIETKNILPQQHLMVFTPISRE